MKTSLHILLIIVLLGTIGLWFVPSAHADDYIDDVYYTPIQDTSVPYTPHYNKHAKEIIFIEDSTTQPNDTVVKAVIRDRT